MKELDMFPPKTVHHSQGALHDPRIPGAVQSPAGSPTHFTNIGCAFSMCFPVTHSVACTDVLTSHDVTLYTFTFGNPIDRDANDYVNGPLIIQGAALQLISDITTTVNVPNYYSLQARLGTLSHSLVSTPNYGSDGLDLFDGGTYDANTAFSGGSDNAVISPGTDANGAVRGTKYAAWASDTDLTITDGNYNAHYLAATTTFVLRATTRRPSSSATISVDVNVFIWGIMLPPLRNP